jgi:hypothetical protein
VRSVFLQGRGRAFGEQWKKDRKPWYVPLILKVHKYQNTRYTNGHMKCMWPHFASQSVLSRTKWSQSDDTADVSRVMVVAEMVYTTKLKWDNSVV